MPTAATSAPPQERFFRVARSQQDVIISFPSVEPVDVTARACGNRWDSYHGNYGTLYFGTTLTACYAETLARFRPDPSLAKLIRSVSADKHFMEPGAVPADWRDRRRIYHCSVVNGLPFVDITNEETVSYLAADPDLMSKLRPLGITSLDLSTLLASDRRVTRLVAQHLSEQRNADNELCWSGIRYVSRLGEGYECWAVFEGTRIELVSVADIKKQDQELLKVASQFKLTIH